MAAIRTRPSPNFGPRPGGTAIDTLVLHYTGMRTAAEALDRLCDAAAQVSAHYLVEEDGTVWRLVEEDMRAWHAGMSWWQGETNLNDRSTGIEIVNPGHEFGYRPFPPAQMAAVAALCRDILARRPIPPARVLGHSDIAPMRKLDPGELFDWRGLAAQGIGLWPATPGPAAAPGPGADEDSAAATAIAGLAAIGYDTEGRSAGRAVDSDAALTAAIAAFQRRFRPGRVDGALDSETCALIAAVARLCG